MWKQPLREVTNWLALSILGSSSNQGFMSNSISLGRGIWHGHKRATRPLDEGIYRILRHSSSSGTKSSQKVHTHLIYMLEFPAEDNENGPQQSLNINREGSFLIQIKKPRPTRWEGWQGAVQRAAEQAQGIVPSAPARAIRAAKVASCRSNRPVELWGVWVPFDRSFRRHRRGAGLGS